MSKELNDKIEREEKSQQFLKIELYILSLTVLFFFIFVLTVDISMFTLDNEEKSICNFLQANKLPALSVLFIFIGIIFYYQLKWRWNGITNPPIKVLKVKNKNYEYLTFLTTYMIPLVCFDLTKIRYVVILFIILLILGFMFIKVDLYYANPILALSGYRLYSIDVSWKNSNKKVVAISKSRIREGDMIKWIYVDKEVWMARGMNDEN